MRISRIAKFALSAIAVIALLAAFNAALSFALVPYGSKSEVVWTQFDAQEEIDTLFVGTSLTARALDPNAFDARYGTHSFNLATPNQTLEESLIGIQTAYERFHIGHVIIAFEYTCMQTGIPNKLGDAYLSQRSRFVSPAQAIAANWWLLTQKGASEQTASINALFPWVFNRVSYTPDAIRDNIAAKRDGMGLIEASEAGEPGWKYYGKGYGNYTEALDYNSEKVALFGEQEHFETFRFDQSKIDTLNELCDYCAANDIELTVIAPPIPVFNVLAYAENYFDNEQVVADILARHGIEYHDFTLAKPELFTTSHAYFLDNSHLNVAGAEAFDLSLMRYMDMQRAEEDVNGLFYSPEEFLASVDYIDATMTDAVSTGDGVMITACALAGPSVSVEYQYWVSYDNANWELVQDYTPQSTCTFVPAEHGTINVRACARKAGGSADYDYYQDATLLY